MMIPLRELMANQPLIIPSAYDCITARLLEESGFPVLHITGGGVAVSHGYPDIGLMTLSEVVAAAARITRTVQAPCIADADDGYGGVVNVVRTVQEFEQAGVAGLHIEDQVFPKRCGHLANKRVVERAEFIAKIRAAIGERSRPDFFIMARTDALAVHGVDEAIDRAKAALDAGADATVVEAPRSRAEVERIAREVPGLKAYVLATGGVSPTYPATELFQMGFHMVFLPGLAMWAVIDGLRRLASAVQEAKSDAPLQPLNLSPRALFELMHLRRWQALEDTYR